VVVPELELAEIVGVIVDDGKLRRLTGRLEYLRESFRASDGRGRELVKFCRP
jgi:hypothetical protein